MRCVIFKKREKQKINLPFFYFIVFIHRGISLFSFKDNLLRSARNPVECAFGRLKARWAILTKKVDLDIKTVPTMIYACFVLHKFCEKNNTSIDEELVRSQIQVAAATLDKEIPDPVNSCNSNEGEIVRDILTQYVGLNLPDQLTS